MNSNVKFRLKVEKRLNQTIVGTDRRHVLRTFNGILHEITYTGPLMFTNTKLYQIV